MDIKKHLIPCIFILCFVAAQGDEELPNGIRFFSVYDDSVPTYLNLTPEKSIPLKGFFTLSFEFSIWKISPFGFITHGQDRKESLFIFSYIDFQNPDTSYFELSDGKGKFSLIIGMPKSALHSKNWIPTELGFDPESQTAYVSMNGQKVEGRFELPNQTDLELNFGRYPLTTDTPNMVLRNIHLTGSKEMSWSLDEGFGDEIFDSITRGRGLLTGGEWLMERHYSWKQRAQLTFSIDPDFVYSSESNSFFFYYGDSIMVVDDHTMGNTAIKMPSVLDSNFAMVEDPFRKTIRGFLGGGEGPVVDWNPKTQRWIMDKQLSSKEAYHGSGKIIDPRNGDFYTIGGYGNYRSNNNVLKYDEKTAKWDTLSVRNLGDGAFNPRQVLSVAWDETRNSALLFIGWGNASGEQEKGFEYVYDLWQFSPDDLTIEKVWEWNSPGKELETLSALALPGKNEFYYIARSKDQKESESILFMGEIGNRNFKKISFSGFNDSKGGSLIYLSKSNELAILHHANERLGKWELMISTLSLPIIIPDGILDQTVAGGRIPYGFVGITAILIGFGTWLYISRRKKQVLKQTGGDQIASEKIIKGVVLKIGGEFRLMVDERAIDLNGIDRHQQIVELLALVAKAPDYRVSHEDIHQSLWPLVQDESFVNSLNVTLSALRKVISPYEKEIIHQNKMVGFGDGIKVI